MRLGGGALLLVGGWLLYYAGVRIVGFLLGFLIGVLVTLSFLHALEFVGQGEGLLAYRTWLAAGLGLILGLISVRLMPKFYLLVVAVVFGLLGLAYQQGIVEPHAVAGHLPRSVEPYVTGPSGAVVMVAAFAAAGVILHRYLVILLTSACGASLIYSVVSASGAVPGLVPVLAGGGILIQLFLSHRLGARRKASQKEADLRRRRKGGQPPSGASPEE